MSRRDNPPPASLREILRQSTAEAHRALDETMGNAGYFDSQVGYAGYLIRMGLLHCKYAGAVEAVSNIIGLDDNTDAILAAIDRDLRAVGVKSYEHETAELTSDSRGEWSSDLAASWGSAYVLEGSSLGSKYVRRTVEAKLATGTSASYLSLMNESARSRWPVFVEHLSKEKGDAERAILAARSVFKSANDLFLDGRQNFLSHAVQGDRV